MGILRTNKVSGLETPTPVTGSVYFDGSGDYLKLASSGDFGYSAGDFTWELWINFGNITSGNYYILDHGTDGGTISYYENILRYYNTTIGIGSVLYATGFGSNFTPTTWYHFAAVRRNGVTSLYTNGVLVSSASDTHNYSAQAISIATYGGTTSGSSSYDFTGYISNLRILKGTALYTSNFTPPVNELQTIGDTVLLCCNNPDSAGAEATGKTITVNGNAAASTFSPGLTRDFTYGTQFSGVTKFDTQGYFVPPSGTTEQRGRGRGVFGGGNTQTGLTNTIQFIQIQSQGNSQDFGDLSSSAMYIGSCSSSTRGLFGGAYISPTYSNTIEYITISTSSKTIDFGDLTRSTRGLASCSSPTRGLFGGGVVLPGNTINNIIDYITIASIGNAIDFGDLTQSRGFLASSSSSIRGIFGGGWTAPSTVVNTIDYVTIASIGNAIDFGDLTQSRGFLASSSSSTRSLFGGGYTPSRVNTIDYITIASTGNAVDFGDLIQPRGELASCSSNIRGVFGGGYTTTPSATRVNTIDYVIITSTGNAQDFGDLLEINYGLTGCSDSHGGLS
jgi:hypothetical protein